MMQASLRIFSGILALSLSGSLCALPDCPSNPSVNWDNCFGALNYADGDKYVGEHKEHELHGRGVVIYPNRKNDQIGFY